MVAQWLEGSAVRSGSSTRAAGQTGGNVGQESAWGNGDLFMRTMGFAQMVDSLGSMEEETIARFDKAGREVALHILAVANKIAPIDTGLLIETSYVFPDPRVVEWQVIYPQEYSELQHNAYPKKRVKGREWKWLDKTIRKEMGNTNKIMTDILGRGYTSRSKAGRIRRAGISGKGVFENYVYNRTGLQAAMEQARGSYAGASALYQHYGGIG